MPDDSKLLLAEELVASINASADSDDALVDRRRAEFLSGAASLIPAEEALRQVRKELASRPQA